MKVSSEFAAVDVGLDSSANGPRLRVEDLKSGHIGYLDALELETLAWLPDRALHGILDPSAVRWTEEDPQPAIAELAKALYEALAVGDAERLAQLLHEDFEASAAEGMPLVAGSVRGARQMIDWWWTLGRAFKVRVEPSDWIPCAGGRLLVAGRYVGEARATAKPFTARVAHLWSARDGRLSGLWHLTDTAAWAGALE